MPPSKRAAPKPFDLGACEQSVTIIERIVDCGAFPAGFPFTQALFVIACLDKASAALIRARVNAALGVLRTLADEWRTCYRRREHLKPLPLLREPTDKVCMAKKEVADGALLAAEMQLQTALAALVGETEMGALMWLLREKCDEQKGLGADVMDVYFFQNFDFPYIEMAHVVLQQCMFCSGQGRRCHCKSPPTRRLVLPSRQKDCKGSSGCGWHVAPHQSGALVFGRAACAHRISLELAPGSAVAFSHDWEHTRPPDGSLSFHPYKNYVLAKAMLRQRGIYNIDHTDVQNVLDMYGDVMWKAGQRVSLRRHFHCNGSLEGRQRPLLLEASRYVQPQFTLQGRLDLDNAAMARAREDCRRVVNMQRNEERAVRTQRHSKWLDDLSMYVFDLTEGRIGLNFLMEWLPTLQVVLEREMCAEVRHINAVEIARLREKTDIAIWSYERLRPAVQEQRRRRLGGGSPHAYEYACSITAVPSNESDVTWPEQRLPYIVAAMHVFDCIGGSWNLCIQVCDVHLKGYVKPAHVTRLRWCLKGSSPTVLLEGNMPTPLHGDLFLLHKHIVTEAARLRRNNLVDVDDVHVLPRVPPSRDVVDGAVAHRWPSKRLEALNELQTFYSSMVGVCVLYPQLRAAGLVLCGLSATRLVAALERYHDRWATDYAGVYRPLGASDFARYVCDAPSADVTWARVETPEAGDSDGIEESEEGEESD